MYTSADGTSFTAITTNGFGDPYNHGLRAFATGDDWMVIGTANPFFGTQLWKMAASNVTVDPVDPTDPEKPAKPENPEKPSKPSKPVTPTNTGKKVNAVQTGDMNNPIVPFAVAGGSLVVVLGAALVLRKKKYEM